MTVSVETVERTIKAIAEQSSKPFAYSDPTTGDRHILTPDVLASGSGYLPAIVSAGEAVWREATGRGFNLDITPDSNALLGYRLRGIGGGPFSAVMLASVEALAQVSDTRLVHVSDLTAVANAALARTAQDAPAANMPTFRKGASP